MSYLVSFYECYGCVLHFTSRPRRSFFRIYCSTEEPKTEDEGKNGVSEDPVDDHRSMPMNLGRSQGMPDRLAKMMKIASCSLDTRSMVPRWILS